MPTRLRYVLLQADLVQIKGQLDDQKQQLHFPEPEGWLVRLGTDGVYVGIKGIALDTLEASFTLRVGKELIVGGDSNHPCMIHIKVPQVTVRVAIDTLAVVGEKGSSVPNFTKARLAIGAEIVLDARFHVTRSKKWRSRGFDCKVSIQQVLCMCVRVSHDVIERRLGFASSLGQMDFIYLFTHRHPRGTAKRATLAAGNLPTSTGNRKRNEKKWISLFSLSRRNDMVLQANEALEVSGELHVYGIPIGVLDQTLKLGKAHSAKLLDATDPSESVQSTCGICKTPCETKICFP